MALPSSQKVQDKPISFALLVNQQRVESITLVIRPEDLTRESPSRVSVSQTLGSAWADSFGAGLNQITIAGHTGWRGNVTEDGLALFQRLRRIAYERWHAERAAAQQSGRDPDQAVELVFADELNGYAAVVVPLLFRLQRSKSRPLLAQYRIQMTELRPARDPIPVPENELLIYDDITYSPSELRGIASEALSASSQRQRDLAARIRDVFAPVYRPAAALAEKSALLLDRVNASVSDANAAYQAVTAPAIALATQVQLASRNLSAALASPLALADLPRQTLQELASAFGEAYCNLNINYGSLSRFLDFTDLYGASNCSSTAGGRPQTQFTDRNPFLELYNGDRPQTTIDQPGAAALSAASGDPLDIAELPESEILERMLTLANGVTA